MERKNLWETMDQSAVEKAMIYAKEYCSFLDKSKTERNFVKEAEQYLQKEGFIPLTNQKSLKTGDKVYQIIHKKGLCAAVIGKDEADEGFNLLGAHVDSPRCDLKPVPLTFSKADMIFLKTHYYGGIKKYQWVAMPLSLQGVVYRKDGSLVEINIGEHEDDPVFCFTDLLPHLAAKQMSKTASEVITGEQLNLLVGGKPTTDTEAKDKFKAGFLQLLKEKYQIDEDDLVSAELEVVPALKSKMIGLDKSFIGAYGQDDRVCAYSAMRSLTQITNPQRTSMIFLYDKEEIGSEGNTGAQSRLYENFQAKVFALMRGGYDELAFRDHLMNSVMLSTDVTNGYDPNFEIYMVCDPLNTNYLGRGLGIFKYTGARGKGGASDASAELLNKVIRIMNKENIAWQIGELGAVDAGGGGTICKYAANTGMQVLDCGVPVLSMHAPYEVTHTLDVYNLYLAYMAFLKNCTKD